MKMVAALIVIAGVFGFFSGAFVCYNWLGYAQLHAQAEKLKSDLRKYRSALGFSGTLDDAEKTAETSNREIVDAIIERANQLQPDGPDDYVCVDAISVQQLRALR